jgi:hypothetical protein
MSDWCGWVRGRVALAFHSDHVTAVVTVDCTYAWIGKNAPEDAVAALQRRSALVPPGSQGGRRTGRPRAPEDQYAFVCACVCLCACVCVCLCVL